MRVIDDVNLDQIVFGRDGKTLRLEFIDMYQGAPVGTLECRDVILLNYNNGDSEGFATYVAAIDICELQPPETLG